VAVTTDLVTIQTEINNLKNSAGSTLSAADQASLDTLAAAAASALTNADAAKASAASAQTTADAMAAPPPPAV
jgi:hypothetical protein